ncbi:SH3 domain-containing protein 19 isoform X2 [Antennarius striatus]|uniref:SH3 domain-containing protein 19 isoform X2 n=1 Tax=Antennarius striatus TaxID=241820 RepID=UPI0035AEC523
MSMAEACHEDGGGDRRDLRDVRGRDQTTDPPERLKPAHSHCSQGPLSSIRAAIKRTKTISQSDQSRDRRRPEITIVSAAPLVSHNWFSGTPRVYPPPPESDWSTGIRGVPQVIQEKSQCTSRPTAAPRRTACTVSSATQTEPVRENPTTPVPSEKRPTGRKPQKPPRPSRRKQALGEPATGGVACTDKNAQRSTTVSATAEETSGSDLNQPGPAHSTLTCSRSVTVFWDVPTYLLSAAAAETSPSSSDLRPGERPVPLPRTKLPKQVIKGEDKLQTLISVTDIHEDIHSDAVKVPEEYLKELLEAFPAEFEESSDIVNQSDEALQAEDGGEMNSKDMSSQRDMRARIQAFEVQSGTSDKNGLAKTEPQSGKLTNKPPVATKPSGSVKLLTQQNTDDSQNVSSATVPPTPAPKPSKKPMGLSVQQELETLHNRMSAPNRSRPSVLTRASCFCEDEDSPATPTPPAKPFKEPLKPNLNFNNHNSASVVTENVYVDSPSNPVVVKPLTALDSRPSMAQRPTIIKVPKAASFSDSPPPLPAQKPVGNTTPILPPQIGREPSLPPRKLTKSETLSPRPLPAKVGPGRPPPPSLKAIGRSHTVGWDIPLKPEAPKGKPQGKGPVLPPRPNPGHRLYNKYILQLPHGIATFDHNGSNTGELSFQKNEVLLLLEQIDHGVFECQVGDAKGRIRSSHMKVITPLDTAYHSSPPQDAGAPDPDRADDRLKVQAIHDFTPEAPEELGLRAGDVVTMVEQVDREWYRGTCRGTTGFFPVNYVKVLSNSPKLPPERKVKPLPPSVSGPRCVARFDFEGEHSDELTFSEGDVIQLKEYAGQDWARGQVGAFIGIFPLNFVEIVEDLPPPSRQQERKSIRIPLPGMVPSPGAQPEVAKPSQTPQSNTEWVVAMYDFAGNSDGDLSFEIGDVIQITKHIDAEWSKGRLNGREGIFPRVFVKSSSGQQSSSTQQEAAAGECRAKALYNFTSDCDEELSLQIGDIITNLESIDEEWFLGELRGKRALVPKNYVKVLD